ncbi:unnamed protein product [Moneuplotes crassus]|uniref:Uncharacterized protein n=1 Tax=Euplotes crassus TaxID=5936 RepID=A0AAD1UCY8_EUPCR|nr:unnamed protein product [Moneuplotes crassus]
MDNAFSQSFTDSEKMSLITPAPPKDHKNIALIFFFLFGISGWSAWDCCIAAFDFYDAKFKPDYDPEFTFGFVFNWPLMLGNILLLYLASRVSLSVRIYTAYAVIVFACYSMPLLSEYLTQKSVAWYLLLLLVVINGFGNAFVQGGLFGYASMFPQKYMIAMMVGQGVNGMTLNSVKMILIVFLPPDAEDPDNPNAFYNSLIFVGIFSIILIGCSICYFILRRMEFSKYYVSKANKQGSYEDSEMSENRGAKIFGIAPTDENTDLLGKSSQTDSSNIPSSLWTIYKKVFYMGLQATIAFGITFLIYPGNLLDTDLDFLKNSSSYKAWFNILMITIFSFGDTVGRFLAGPLKVFNKDTLIIFSVGRIIFVPTTVLIQKEIAPDFLFCADWFRIIHIFLFAATNGYNVSLAMPLGPEQVKDSDKERAAMIMNFHLIAGVCIGTVLQSFAMSHI